MSGPRKCASWIESFVDATDGKPSPILFRKWSAITALSGAVERRVWTVASGGPVFPNLFTILVGGPGGGKSQAINTVRQMWEKTKELNVAPTKLTREKLIVDLAEKCPKTKTLSSTTLLEYSSYLVGSSELGNLLPENDTEMMNTLNELYDCTDTIKYHTKNSGEFNVNNSHMTFLAGTQPAFLAQLFPDISFGLGFASRLLFVYSGEDILKDMFTVNQKPGLEADLLHDLKLLLPLHGTFTWSEDGKKAYRDWHLTGMAPMPTIAKLSHYNARRPIHFMKLCMVGSLDKGSDLIVTGEHVAWAKAQLLEIEAAMPEAFKDISSSSDYGHVQEIFEWLVQQCVKLNRPVMEHELFHFASKKVPTQKIKGLIESMVQSNMIKVGPVVAHRLTYIPLGKDEHSQV